MGQRIEYLISLVKGFVAELRRRPTVKLKIGYALSVIKGLFEDEKSIRILFDISLVIKGVIAAFEFIGGIILYYISQQFLLDLVVLATRGELQEDPRDLIANFLLHTAQNLSISTQHFTALYLIGHGIIKLWVIVGLLRKKLWYYPVAMIVFGLFIAYELYEFSLNYSIWLLLVSILDAVVIWLTWHEYNYLRSPRDRKMTIS